MKGKKYVYDPVTKKLVPWRPAGEIVLPAGAVKCERCGLEWTPDNTTRQAMEEFRREFPGLPEAKSEIAVLCDPCWRAMTKWLKAVSLDN